MCRVLCPKCGKRIFDIKTATRELVIVKLKCSHCQQLVTVECRFLARENQS